MAFIDRLQTGQHQNLIALRAVVNFHQIYFEYLNLPQLGEEGFDEGRTGWGDNSAVPD